VWHRFQNIERSLKRLQTSYVDILFVHMWDVGTPIEETLSALTDLVRAGKIHYLGASNFTGWQVSWLILQYWTPFVILSCIGSIRMYRQQIEHWKAGKVFAIFELAVLYVIRSTFLSSQFASSEPENHSKTVS
jgi:aryl-alcohol dehydrogenase-like predicted oxidoreductase